jgi:hypothetical protein
VLCMSMVRPSTRGSAAAQDEEMPKFASAA